MDEEEEEEEEEEEALRGIAKDGGGGDTCAVASKQAPRKNAGQPPRTAAPQTDVKTL